MEIARCGFHRDPQDSVGHSPPGVSVAMAANSQQLTPIWLGCLFWLHLLELELHQCGLSVVFGLGWICLELFRVGVVLGWSLFVWIRVKVVCLALGLRRSGGSYSEWGGRGGQDKGRICRLLSYF